MTGEGGGHTGRRVVITGSGLLSPLGDTSGRLHEALCAGRSGLKETEFEEMPELGRPLAGAIDFDPREYLVGGKLRPLDRVGRMVISAARLALESADLPAEACLEREIGLVLGTMFCSVHTIVAFDQRALEAGPKYVRPFDFANTVINAAAGQTAIWHRLRGVNSTLAGGTAAGLEALAYAADLIRTGRSEIVLAGGSDELCCESYLSFQRTGQLGAGQPVPFDERSDGFALSEGAALLVLESENSARERGAQILATLEGHASGFDPSRGRDADESRRYIARTLGLAMHDAGVDSAGIDAVSSSANGLPDHDRREALGLRDAFRGRSSPVPTSAVKAMLGEALGASGALQSLSLLESLRSGVLPGIPQLKGAAEADLMERGGGAFSLAGGSREIEMRRGLISAVGLDGNICAMVMAAGAPS
ncbi:MAG: beta-ketoacyl synthase N-terminal-like domain-containing protein [Acidobacteriota bacterium]